MKNFGKIVLLKREPVPCLIEKEEIVILQRKKDMLGIEYHEEVFRLGGGAIAEFLEEVLNS